MSLFSLKSEINKFSSAKQKEWAGEILNHISLIVEGVNPHLSVLQFPGVEDELIIYIGEKQNRLTLVEVSFQEGTDQSPVILNVTSHILQEEKKELHLPHQNNELRLLIKRAYDTHTDD